MSKDPEQLAKTLVIHLAKLGIVVSKKTVTRILHRNGLQGCRPWKTPLLQKRRLQVRLKHAKDKLATQVLLVFGERLGEAYNPKNTVHTVKHGGGSITQRCDDASVYRKLGILSRRKKPWRKKDMWRPKEKPASSNTESGSSCCHYIITLLTGLHKASIEDFHWKYVGWTEELDPCPKTFRECPAKRKHNIKGANNLLC